LNKFQNITLLLIKFYNFIIKFQARTQGIEFLMESVGSQLRRFQLPVDDEGDPHLYVDTITPAYYSSLQMSQ
jgi:hypothetical protein